MSSSTQSTSFEDIDKLYTTAQDHFRSRATIPLAYRIYYLKQLACLVQDNREAIHAAVKEDLGGGDFQVDICDLYPVLNEINLAIDRLPTWVKDETRYADSMLAFKFMSPRVVKQPKGVVLIISPWNYPWQLTLTPLVNAIAAGCPAIMKPAEMSPASSRLMAKLIPLYLDPMAYSVVQGGPEVSTHLLKKQWGHIMYTGSDRVGKIVARAAADTLTPCTLELGGKSPVFVTKDADLVKTARRLFTIKQLNAGQICVSPDYVLCEKEVVDEFIAICKQTLDSFFPPSPHPGSLLHTPMSSHLLTEQSFARQQSLLESVGEKGKVVYQGESDFATRRIGFSLVKMNEDGLGEDGPLLDEEIFGTVLPIIPVSSLDKALEWVNDRPHPLAVYVCSRKKAVFDRVVRETISGSVTWNDFAFATFARSLPFGGVGGSGWGRYHGYDGFKEFSHLKSTLQIPLLFEPLMSLRYPPMTTFGQRILRLLLASPKIGRPKSIADEERKLWWRRWRPMVVFLCVLVVAGAVGGGVGGTRR